MKKILSLVLVVVLALTCIVACNDQPEQPTEKTYTLVVVTDSDPAAKLSNHVLAIVFDAEGKIVAARLDCAQVTLALGEDGNVVPQSSVATKVELKENYGSMPAGTWYVQADAFEKLIVGKTAAEVAALSKDAISAAGCTMASTTPLFQALVTEAANSTNKVTFTTSEDITLGVAIHTTVAAGRSGGATISSNFAGVVLAGGKVVAAMIDVSEQTYTVADGALVPPTEAKPSKNEQGEGYTGMPAGPWYKQGQAFANSAVGKTVADLANLELTSDALAAAGCTMQGTADYRTALVAAANYAR